MRPANPSSASPLLPDSSGGQHLPLMVLRQYVAGSLSAAELHRVEAHTLGCSRCADVLEGLSQTDLPTTDRALATLQTRLRVRVAEEAPEAVPALPLWPWRQLAATLLLLLVASAVWLGVRQLTDGSAAAPQVALRQPAMESAAAPVPSPSVASAPLKAQAATDATAATVASAPAPAGQKAAPARQPRVALRLQTKRPLSVTAAAPAGSATGWANEAAAMAASEASGNGTGSRGSGGTDTTRLARSNAAPASEEKAEAYGKAKVAAPVAARARLAPAQVPDRKDLESRITSAVAAPAGTRVVRGRVTDRASGTGLPGVTVLAKGRAIGASTAADGSFALVVPESVRMLTFSSIGYGTSEQALTPTDTTLALVLAPDPRQLSEVVVRREPPPAPIFIGALPTGGYKVLREYLKQELEYPEQALRDGKEGTVRLRFVVAVDGSLRDIKVVRGLSTECDAEAVRLLKEGPKWYPAIQKGRRTARPVEISVPFRME